MASEAIGPLFPRPMRIYLCTLQEVPKRALELCWNGSLETSPPPSHFTSRKLSGPFASNDRGTPTEVSLRFSCLIIFILNFMSSRPNRSRISRTLRLPPPNTLDVHTGTSVGPRSQTIAMTPFSNIPMLAANSTKPRIKFQNKLNTNRYHFPPSASG
jgi:hypothetical protein